MSCDCDSPSGDSSVTSADNPIDIDSPATTPYGPAKIDIPSGCVISTHGRIDIYNFPNLRALHVWGSIDGGRETPGNCSDGVNWNVDGVQGAHWSYAGVDQTVRVRVICSDSAAGTEREFTQNREFIGISGDPACQYYGLFRRNSGGRTLAGEPIEEVMPRYFRVSAEFGGDVSFGMMAGGLISLNSVFLAYDLQTSTPECPVWRDTGLPPGVGGWLLRVARAGVGYEARLSIQLVTETCVLPSQLVLSRHWEFHAKNMLHGMLEIGNSKTSVTLIVEPA